MSTAQTLPTDPTPVYCSLTVFRAAVQNLRAHGLPDEIDRTAFNSRSGSEQGQILTGFRFLGLIDERNRTQATLRKLSDAPENSPEEKAILAELLRTNYKKLFEDIDLKTATPGQVAQQIGAYGVTGNTRDRAVRFFLKTAQYAGIPLSTRLTMGLRDRADNSTSAAGPNDPEVDDENAITDDTNGATTTSSTPSRRRARRRPRNTEQRQENPGASSTAAAAATGNAVKVVTLKGMNGANVTLSGTFNPFELDGKERKLVYDIIDLMKKYELEPENQ